MKRSIALLLMLCLALCGCGEKKEEKAVATPKPEKIEVTLTAVGDNLIHAPIYRQALERGGDTYDFYYAYANIEEYIDSDINILNQETPVGGTELGISSYPSFNSPYELGTMMKKIGFNVINHANNHIYDAGELGVVNSMNFWEENDIPVIGMHSVGSENRITYMDVNGARVALLAYTYGTNVGRRSEDFAVNRLYEDDLENDLKEARKNSDIVILSLHFGNEYELINNDEQEKYAKIAAKCNADILIGHHPHVIQNVEELTRADGKIMPVYYSLGNFISSQEGPKSMIGGMVKAKFSGTKGNMKLEASGFLPVVTHFGTNWSDTRTYLFRDYTEELASSHGLKSSGFTYEYAENLINSVIDERFLKSGEAFVH